MNTRATGRFDVTLVPQPPDPSDQSQLGRMSIDKTFAGDLEATSQGQMLATQSAVPGSAGYVAMERVTGTLQGRSGTFVLQHTGIMDRGAPQLTITVVPDSGTASLSGLTGRMNITITKGEHSYELDYALTESE